jgi:ankyrin repeat protein
MGAFCFKCARAQLRDALPAVAGAASLEFVASPSIDADISDAAAAVCRAALAGNTARLLALHDEGADLGAHGAGGLTPLMLAARGDHLDAAWAIALRARRFDAQDERGRSALFHAAAGGFARIVRQLVRFGARHDLADASGTTPLLVAAAAGHRDVVDLLAQLGSNVCAVDTDGCSAVHLAAAGGHAAAVELLLCMGVDADAWNNHGRTALHLAAAAGAVRVVALLLANGSSPLARDALGCSALHLAVQAEAELAQERAGAADSKGDDVDCHLASECRAGTSKAPRDYLGCIALLLKAGALAADRGGGAWTSLHVAARLGRLEAARMLLEAGASAEAETAAQVMAEDGTVVPAGSTPLSLAADDEMHQLLLAAARAKPCTANEAHTRPPPSPPSTELTDSKFSADEGDAANVSRLSSLTVELEEAAPARPASLALSNSDSDSSPPLFAMPLEPGLLNEP